MYFYVVLVGAKGHITCGEGAGKHIFEAFKNDFGLGLLDGLRPARVGMVKSYKGLQAHSLLLYSTPGPLRTGVLLSLAEGACQRPDTAAVIVYNCIHDLLFMTVT